MQPSRFVLFALVLLACRREPDLTCPDGTTARFIGESSLRRVCIEADHITGHGPIVEIGPDGVERLVGRMVHGKRDGKFVERVVAGFVVESFFRDGLVEGLYTLRDANGVPVSSQQFRRGRRHGWRRDTGPDGSLKKLEIYDNGVPAGEWEDHGPDGVTRRLYGAAGVLLAVDGQRLPPPRESILVEGGVLTREECLRRAKAFAWDGVHPPAEPPCLDIFEDVQRCADDPCRAAAIAAFANRR